jgi:hypothetical protein
MPKAPECTDLPGSGFGGDLGDGVETSGRTEPRTTPARAGRAASARRGSGVGQ